MPSFTLDDTEEPLITILDQEHVYSFMFFVGAIESRKEGYEGRKNSITCDTFLAYALVFLTLFMQGLILYCIYTRVVLNQIDWEAGILLKKERGMSVIGNDGGGTQCNPGTSLCTISDAGVFSCAPPTVKLTGRWEELDTNGDGVWTRDEVVAAKEALQCKYIVNPVEVFDVFINFIKNRKKIIWIHPAVEVGDSIPKPYFTYASGDIIMCGYRNEKMCPNLLDRGYFNAALEHNTVPRVGNTIDSALTYCHALLSEGGLCEQSLPSTYTVWKVKSGKECGHMSFSKIVYKHPTSGDFKSMVAVDYSARKVFEKTLIPMFKVYKTLVIALWVMAMVDQLRQLHREISWCAHFPSLPPGDEPYVQIPEEPEEQANEEVEGEEKAEEDAEQKETPAPDPDAGKTSVIGITGSTRAVITFVTMCRLLMTIVLFIVGNSLLLASQDYMSLIFDAVSLVFVVDIAGLMYTQIMRDGIRGQTENVQSMTVTKIGLRYLTMRPGLEDFAWMLVVFIVAIGLMAYHYEFSVKPMGKALLCTCLSEGPECDEAQRFSYDFWYNYWHKATPQVFRDVDFLKNAYEGQERPSLLATNSTSAMSAALVADMAAVGHMANEAASPVTTQLVQVTKGVRRAALRASRAVAGILRSA